MRSFAAGAPAGDVMEKPGIANSDGQIASFGPAYHDGLQFIFTSGRSVPWAEWNIIECWPRSTSLGGQIKEDFSPNRHSSHPGQMWNTNPPLSCSLIHFNAP